MGKLFKILRYIAKLTKKKMSRNFSNSNSPLLGNEQLRKPDEAILDLSYLENYHITTPANTRPAYWKPKKNRWWRTLVLLFFCMAILSAFAVLIWKMASV